MSDVAIRVEGLAKRFRLGASTQSHDTLKDALTSSVSRGLRTISSLVRRNGEGRSSREFIWALRDVSFAVNQGEVLGVIGRNGAGKSTLLKVVSRITEPTAGYAEIHGRVAALLEVGTGFHYELNGRENIYLNGAILGMRKTEIDRKFDEIVDFAEVARFIDTPLKHYSSGMYLRLAFAVAAHLEPEILIVDEVLAVGDAAFQKKCLGKMSEVARGGRTIIFVSHNLAAISSLCTSAIVLDGGEVACSGSTRECIEHYTNAITPGGGSTWSRSTSEADGKLVFIHMDAKVSGDQPRLKLDLNLELESRSAHKPAFLAVDIVDSSGFALMQALPMPDGFISDSSPRHNVNLSIDLPPMIPGRYFATLWVGSHNTETLDEIREAICFDVHESPTPGRSFPHSTAHGFLVPRSLVSYEPHKSDGVGAKSPIRTTSK